MPSPAWIVVEAFPNELMAMIAKGQLEDADIPCQARLHQRGDALLGGLGMLTGPHELLVDGKNVERARKVLADGAA